MVPAQAHGPWTGARWPRVASGRPVSPSHSPARSAPKREVPPLRSGAPRHAPVGQFGAHAAPVKEAPSSAWTQMPRVLNSPSTAAPTAMQPPRAGHPGGRRGAMGTDRARGRSRGRNASKGPCAPPFGRPRGAPRRWSSGTVPAQRPHRSWTPGGGGYRAPSCPGVQADDHRIQAARAGAVPCAPSAG